MRNEKGIDDFFQECYTPNQTKVSPQQFDEAFCQVCKNLECVRAGWAESAWVQRMATQVDRLLENPTFADERDPRFRHVREHDFPSLLQEALRVEIIDQKNDWSIPTNQDVQDLMVGKGMSTHELSNDISSKNESSTTSEEKNEEHNPHPLPQNNPPKDSNISGGFSEDTENPSRTSQIQSIKQEPQNPFINTPFPKEGVSLEVPTPKKPSSDKVQKPPNFIGDAWTSPEMKTKPKNLVKKGARIQMGGTPKKD